MTTRSVLSDADLAQLAELGDRVRQPLRSQPYIVLMARELQQARAALRRVRDIAAHIHDATLDAKAPMTALDDALDELEGWCEGADVMLAGWTLPVEEP